MRPVLCWSLMACVIGSAIAAVGCSAGKRLTVAHEAIPGFMSAMTMTYPLKDGRQLEHLSKGDTVSARLVTSGGDLWLEDVSVFRAVATPK